MNNYTPQSTDMTTEMCIYMIYKHTCIVTNKSYIGQTKNLDKRNKEHSRLSSACVALRNAVKKYGWKNFTTEILAETLTLDQANELEERLIAEHNTLAPRGYNLQAGGKNHTVAECVRLKISNKKKGIPRTEEAKQRMRGPRGPQPNMRKSKNLTVEQRRKLSERTRQQNLGKTHTEETKLKMKKPHGKRPLVVCPFCLKEGADSLMKRWHFSKCKSKTVE